ncbi:MFS monocarboxylate transporter [Beauveria bassiana ARSEF 2860]|uniref:MFS monocarboxylate transporter n=1 Tax=Beauveria bassiana (strain ARSEF 2860) TaxID=655819 RepID=J5JT56_BEAB2|nr:MFS monocarboxylate transporter [Beauveria bassiana ARSEF 2860]EJP65781.1 MFS monocarboxylate transporter [Beauveria bassiana ARSEF 2860]
MSGRIASTQSFAPDHISADQNPESAYTSEQGSAVKGELDSLAANPPPTPTTEPIPNGGWKAWLQVFGAHLLFFNSWGIINTFGASQAYYESGLLRSHSGYQISWICTFQGFLLILFNSVAGLYFLPQMVFAGAVAFASIVDMKRRSKPW